MGVKLTDAEKAIIAELKDVARRWPKSLLIGGGVAGGPRLSIWKRVDECECREVAIIPKIKNLDAF